MVCYMHFTKMGDRKILQQINKIRKFFAKKYRLKIFFKKKSLLSSQNNTLNFCKNYTNFALFLYFDTVLLAICIPSDSRISTISLSVNFLLLLERISEIREIIALFEKPPTCLSPLLKKKVIGLIPNGVSKYLTLNSLQIFYVFI